MALNYPAFLPLPIEIAHAPLEEWAVSEFIRVLSATLAPGEIPIAVEVDRHTAELPADSAYRFQVTYVWKYGRDDEPVEDTVDIVVYRSRFGKGECHTV